MLVVCLYSDAITKVFKFFKESSEKMSVIFHNYIIDYKNLLQ